MTTLTDFLLARIAEDSGRMVHEFDCDRFVTYDYGARQGTCDCDATKRVQNECESKRKIVELAAEASQEFDYPGYVGETVLELLALPYADHPDYREDWKP